MQPTNLKELEWLHDCVLLHVVYDIPSNAGWSIKLAMRCPADLGYAPWEGKTLTVTAIDVATSTHVVHGVAGQETIDAIRPGISAALRESTMEGRRMGIRFPDLEFTVCFHSGSAIQVICQKLQVDVTG
jgi:hypothetical protein